jgi:hypothetical protein
VPDARGDIPGEISYLDHPRKERITGERERKRESEKMPRLPTNPSLVKLKKKPYQEPSGVCMYVLMIDALYI